MDRKERENNTYYAQTHTCTHSHTYKHTHTYTQILKNAYRHAKNVTNNFLP